MSRFHGARPQQIRPPKSKKRSKRIEDVPFADCYPDIKLPNVSIAKRLPKEESKLRMKLVVSTGLFLNRVAPPMQPGLPDIDADVRRAQRFALTWEYRAMRQPRRPPEFDGDRSPRLGELAVRGPYSVFLERDDDGQLQWDFRKLGKFDYHPGLHSLDVRVLFERDEFTTTKLVATSIESEAYGAVGPQSPDWDRSTTLAIAAATTHLALTRHFNYVHLISGNHWNMTVRNNLRTDHYLYRLLWPHIYNSLYTNYGVTRVQMLPDGDFVNMFSFTHDGLMSYFDEMYTAYSIAVIDPEADWRRRKLDCSNLDTPTQKNLCELFTVAHEHAKRYIEAYYPTDVALQSDVAVTRWLGELDQLVPNGLGLGRPGSVTRANLARLIGGFIFEGCTMHELGGTVLWNYQLWPDRNPTRVYQDGRRVPVDVYQRVINNNFSLQLRRAPLLHDYGYLALDGSGRTAFSRFHEDCTTLQERYNSMPADPSRLEPKILEINMNG